MKRYFAVIFPSRRSTEAVLLAGYELDGKVLSNGRRYIGFTLDHYKGETRRYRRQLGGTIIGRLLHTARGGGGGRQGAGATRGSRQAAAARLSSACPTHIPMTARCPTRSTAR